MRIEDVREGMRVHVARSAIPNATSFVGRTGVVTSTGDGWVWVELEPGDRVPFRSLEIEPLSQSPEIEPESL